MFILIFNSLFSLLNRFGHFVNLCARNPHYKYLDDTGPSSTYNSNYLVLIVNWREKVCLYDIKMMELPLKEKKKWDEALTKMIRRSIIKVA